MKRLAVGRGECVADVVDVSDEAAAQVDGLRSKVLSLPGAGGKLSEAAAKGFIDEIAKAFPSGFPQLLQLGGDVVIEGKRRSHASKHKSFDALMSMPGIIL